MDANQQMMARSLAAVWHPCTQMKQHESLPLVPVRRAEGVWLHDFEGRRYLDAISSWWVNLFGHCNAHINGAIAAQLDRLEHLILAGFTHEPVVRLSEHLRELSGGELGHCFYASDGASAIEIALKMSFHYWRNRGATTKRHFIALENGYHGETLGALGVTDIALFKEAYAPLLHVAATMPTPDARRAEAGESAEAFAVRRAAELERYLADHHREVAALIVEPLVQCAAGMAMHHPRYLTEARRLCDRYGVHLIADEIAVGCGRTGTFFAHEQADIRPDFLCLSKGLSGGYLPLSVVMTSDAVYQAFYSDEVTRGFLHSHSYTGNALACAAALATLELFKHQDVLARNRILATQLTQRCDAIRAHPAVQNFRQTGMIWAFDIADAPAGFARRFAQQSLDRGVLLRPIGNTVYFMPPYVISDSDIQHLVDATLGALQASLDR